MGLYGMNPDGSLQTGQQTDQMIKQMVADATKAQNQPVQNLQDYVSHLNDPRVKNIANAVSSGQMNLNDAMAAIQNLGDSNLSNAAMAALSTDPVAGQKLASFMVQNDPLTKGLFGAGGIQDQAQSQYGQLYNQYQQAFGNALADRDQANSLNGLLDQDRNALMGRDPSYGLQDSDLQAYAQAAGNITRQFGAQANNLSQMLGQRGLADASNGVASQNFSNLYGNQAEQLAGLQQQISQNRIQSALQLAQARTSADLQRQQQAISQYGTSAGLANTANNAVGQNQGFIQNLGVLGQNAKTNAFNQALQGSETQYNTLAGAAGLQMQNTQLGQQQQMIDWSKNPNNPQNQGPGIGNYLGAGIAGAIGKGFGTVIGNAF